MSDWEPLPDVEVYRRLARGWPPDGTDPVVVVPIDSLVRTASRPTSLAECPLNSPSCGDRVLPVVRRWVASSSSASLQG